MRKFIFYIIVGLLSTIKMYTQPIITLEECKEKAIENYPMIIQYALLNSAEDYTLSNISKNYLPQFTLNGQATYQSDVTKLPIDLGLINPSLNIPEMSKDQYKTTVDMSQLIWDGGMLRSKAKTVKADIEVERQQTAVNLYQINDRVNQLYFGILLINEQLKILDLREENLLSSKETAQSMFINGVAMQSDLDQIDVELLNLQQNRIEQQSMKESYLAMLSLFIHEELPPNTILQKPNDAEIVSIHVSRPELSLYNAQINQQNARESEITAKNLPQISFFAQGGYGRPGLNMLEDKFKLFALGGIKLTWNFGNLYTKKNELKLIDNNKYGIEAQRKTFLFNTNLDLTQEQSEILKTKKMLEKDEDIIRLRNRIKTASESKYRNGIYKMNELIQDINAETIARQTKALREIQYLQGVYKYKYIQGE